MLSLLPTASVLVDHSVYDYIQGDSQVIMGVTKFVTQPAIHVPHTFLVSVFIDYST
jgi:hypothetical protein